MKQSTRIHLFVFVFIVKSYCGFAQKDSTKQAQKDIVISLGGGLSTIGVFTNGLPSLNLNVDKDYKRKFSLGLGLTFEPITSGLSRLNIGARGLYHLDKTDRFDFYGGARIGASIWMGTGTLMPDILPIPISNTVRPSVQGILGGRIYLIKNLIGVNAEIALGSPYFFQMGFSYNLYQTKPVYLRFKKHGNDYEKDLKDDLKRNVVKINTLNLLAGNVRLSYERYIANRFSFQIMAYYLSSGTNGLFSIQDYDSADSLEENEIGRKGFIIAPSLRYYLSSSNKNAFPKGVYLGAEFRYNYNVIQMEVVDIHKYPSALSYNHQITSQRVGSMVSGGYQFKFSKKLYLDIFLGLKYDYTISKSVVYKEPSITEEQFKNYYVKHNGWETNGLSFSLGINLGYAF